MGMEDLFKPHHRGGKYGHHDRHGHGEYRHGKHSEHLDDGDHHGEIYRLHDRHKPGHYGRHGDLLDLSHLSHRLLANTKLLVLAGLVLLAVMALAAIFLLPLLGQAVGYIERNGLKGLLETVWQGTGGGR